MSSKEKEEKEAASDNDDIADELSEELSERDERRPMQEDENPVLLQNTDSDDDSPRPSRENVDESVLATDSEASKPLKERPRKKLRTGNSSEQDSDDDNDDDDDIIYETNSDSSPSVISVTSDIDSDEECNPPETRTLERLGITLNESAQIWRSHNSLRSRELGRGLPYMFSKNVAGSLNMIQKFKLERKLEYHAGCVNTLNFNESGDLLASGSDDLNVVLWDWAKGQKRFHYESGHSGNVFQVGLSY